MLTASSKQAPGNLLGVYYVSVTSTTSVSTLPAAATTDTATEAAAKSAATSAATLPGGQATAGATLLKPLTATGNGASALSPELEKVGTHTGNRDIGISAMKARLARITNLLRMPDLPAAFKARLTKEYGDTLKTLQKSVAVDWLTNVAWASGARPEVVKALDRASVEVVPDSQVMTSADAAFDETRDVIVMKQSTIDGILKDVGDLASKNLLNEKTGQITNPDAIKSTAAYHDLMATNALFGAHEVSHMNADHAGEITAKKAEIAPLVAEYSASTGAQRAQLGQELVRDYITTFEKDAYTAQEKFQWEMGAAPEKTAWMTIDNNGQPLNGQVATDNIVAELTKRGFTADMVTNILADPAQTTAAAPAAAAAAVGTDQAPGGKFPGGKFPGGKFPGQQLPGGKFPGGKFPGQELPGGKFPGGKFPGGKFPGGKFPGGKFPGGKFPGGKFPGTILE